MLRKVLHKVKVFGALPWATKILFVEAYVTSAWVKMSLKFFPFKKVMGWLGSAHVESETQANPETLPTRKQVQIALRLCKKYALWPTECYTLSLTGKLLLKRRNINSTLYIGFNKDQNNHFKGHAWLRANDTYISGFREAAGFQVHSIFS